MSIARKEGKERKRVINKSLREAVVHFFEYHSAKRFSTNLRRMLLQQLTSQDFVQSIYFEETIRDIEGLFDLLDVAEQEWPRNPLN